MTTAELIEFTTRSKLVAVAISNFHEKDFDYIEVWDDGSVAAHFSIYYHGNFDSEIVNLTLEEIYAPIEKIVAQHNELMKEQLRKETEANLIKQKIKEKKKLDVDFETYNILKLKFEKK